ncbi:MAG: hypothetical protein JJE21_11105, partial [Spirochaetaceae bacterium]|nr:hypothetical protein [Spirochaetaceae bacterium]
PGIPDDIKALQAEVARLQKELKDEKLRADAYDIMIDIAESKFNIPIRKKDRGIGGMKIWQMCKRKFAGNSPLGRDRFEDVVNKPTKQKIFHLECRMFIMIYR